MNASKPLPVSVTNFPEQPFDWVGLSSLIISVIALAVATWSMWWAKTAWALEGPALKANARIGVNSELESGKPSNWHFSLTVFVSNQGRSPIQCYLTAVEFYGKSDPSAILHIDHLNEEFTLEGGHIWIGTYERNKTIAKLRSIGEEISGASLVISTVFDLERHKFDLSNIEYLNKLIKPK